MATGLLAACGGGGGSGGSSGFGGGTGGGGVTPAVADLTVVLSKAAVANNSDGLVDVTVTSIDANRVAVGGAPVSFAIDSGGVVTPGGNSTATTTGVVKAVASFGADRTSRTIKLTVTSGSIVKTVSFDVVDSVSGGRVADLAMTLNRPTIPNDGSQPVLITITSLDASRQALGGSPITLKVTDTGDAFVSGPVQTDATTGQMVATVSLASNKTNRSISLTATSGTVTRTVSFSVVDAINPVPIANDLTLDLDRTNIGNAGSEFVTVTATVVDTRRNVVTGAPVSFSSDTGNVTVLNGQTDVNGQAKAQVRIAGDKSQRLIAVTASSGTLSRTAAFAVTGVTIQATVTPALPAAGSAGNKVEYRVVDVNQSAMVGIPITVTPSVVAATSAAGPIVQSGVTNANGAFVYTYTAPATPGPLGITAVAAGQTNQQTVTIPSASTVVPNAASTPSSPTLSVSPSVVRVNVGTDTSNRAEIRALFLEPVTNKPVKNVRVRFDLNGDPLNIGGTVAAGSSIVYTDDNGVAVTSYAPGTRSSPTNGLTIRVCWSTTGDEASFPVNTCPNAPTLTSLTVVSDPLSVSIGTDNSIQNGPTGLTYIKQFVLLVVDAAGNPKADVQLTPVVDLRMYRKGFYTWNPGLSAWILTDTAACTNEDTNRNGVIDTGEDVNGNGQLDPRKSDVAVSLVGGTRTDANGTALMKLEYPKSFAGWIDAFISVTAAGVLSPPATIYRRLDVEAQALKTETPPPAFQISPFGTSSSCNNAL